MSGDRAILAVLIIAAAIIAFAVIWTIIDTIQVRRWQRLHPWQRRQRDERATGGGIGFPVEPLPRKSEQQRDITDVAS
jgi:hypothetical protein